MTNTKHDKPLFRVSFSRITGKNETGQDILARPKEIGAAWARKGDKQGAIISLDIIPTDLVNRNSGINVLMLWGAAIEGGYQSPFWMTYRQAKEYGAHVRKGERGNLVVYASTITKTEEQDDGSEEERTIPFMKGAASSMSNRSKGCPSISIPNPSP